MIALLLALALVPATPSRPRIDRDLTEALVTRLHALYGARRYTVAQVVRWHLDRIARYNGT